MGFMNVIEIVDGAVISNRLFTEVDKASATFCSCVRKHENKPSKQFVIDCLEDGIYEDGTGYSVCLNHPEVIDK